MSDNKRSKKRQVAVFSLESDLLDILCKPETKKRNTSRKLPASPKNYQGSYGSSIARGSIPMAHDDAAVNFVSNAPELETPVDNEVPDEYQFEIFRLRRRVMELESIARDKDRRIVRAIAMLEDDLQMFRTFMQSHIGETIGTLIKRIGRLESTLAHLKDKNAHDYPSMEISERWRYDKSRRER